MVERLELKIGFIGGGQMALSLGKGCHASGVFSFSQILVSAPSNTHLPNWKDLGASTTHSNLQVLQTSDLIFIAVKPQVFEWMMSELQEVCKRLEKSPVFVSLMAGISLGKVERSLKGLFETSPAVIRAQTNTCVQLGMGCTVLTPGEWVSEENFKLVTGIFQSVGLCERVPESLQDAFTGLAGSGPAYIYMIIEALSDGAVYNGLPRGLASSFAAQMTAGAAKMVLESGKHTGQLKDEVTSPGGTTLRGLQILERAGLRGTLIDAVTAATQHSQELGKL